MFWASERLITALAPLPIGDANFAGSETFSAVDVVKTDALVDRVAVAEGECSPPRGWVVLWKPELRNCWLWANCKGVY